MKIQAHFIVSVIEAGTENRSQVVIHRPMMHRS